MGTLATFIGQPRPQLLPSCWLPCLPSLFSHDFALGRRVVSQACLASWFGSWLPLPPSQLVPLHDFTLGSCSPFSPKFVSLHDFCSWRPLLPGLPVCLPALRRRLIGKCNCQTACNKCQVVGDRQILQDVARVSIPLGHRAEPKVAGRRLAAWGIHRLAGERNKRGNIQNNLLLSCR